MKFEEKVENTKMTTDNIKRRKCRKMANQRMKRKGLDGGIKLSEGGEIF